MEELLPELSQATELAITEILFTCKNELAMLSRFIVPPTFNSSCGFPRVWQVTCRMGSLPFQGNSQEEFASAISKTE
eukprot:1610853-Amphidinium_carterae.1